ncbi:hypothetical protein AGMMS50255_6830 [Spirochaetia bacterium]|nr:hypothetical protein AGMMS50255_6830 [Spirochaetia bacterium]
MAYGGSDVWAFDGGAIGVGVEHHYHTEGKNDWSYTSDDIVVTDEAPVVPDEEG